MSVISMDFGGVYEHLGVPSRETRDAIGLIQEAGHRIHIISWCSSISEIGIRSYLAAGRRFRNLGISPEEVHFRRKPEEKAQVAFDIKATHHVDDHSCVVRAMVGIVPNPCFFWNTSPLLFHIQRLALRHCRYCRCDLTQAFGICRRQGIVAVNSMMQYAALLPGVLAANHSTLREAA